MKNSSNSIRTLLNKVDIIMKPGLHEHNRAMGKYYAQLHYVMQQVDLGKVVAVVAFDIDRFIQELCKISPHQYFSVALGKSAHYIIRKGSNCLIANKPKDHETSKL